MATEEIESQDVETEADAEDTEDADAGEDQDADVEDTDADDDTTEETQKTEKKAETPQQKDARLKRELARLHKKNPELTQKQQTEKKAKPKTEAQSELSDAVLDYFELKGVTEQEDIDVIKGVMEKTGQSHRDVLKDDYVVSKLAANKQARDVADATPSGTKRSGQGNANSEDFWYGKYSQKWELPSGMPKGMSEKLVNRRYEEESPSNVPF